MRQLLLLLFLTIGSMAYAQNAIAVHKHDGQVIKFAFSEKPVITYSEDQLVISTTQTVVQYPIYALKKISLEVDMRPTEIEEVRADEQFYFDGETLVVSDGAPHSMVYIYDLAGIKMGQYPLTEQGNATISLQGWGKSIYIVKTEKSTFKFSK